VQDKEKDDDHVRCDGCLDDDIARYRLSNDYVSKANRKKNKGGDLIAFSVSLLDYKYTVMTLD
jgi:hypothetical protein